MKNGTLLQYFHWYYPADGSLWKKLVADTGYLQSLGISAVWLPPAYKGIHGDQSIGYDTYDLFDLGEFDQKGSVNTKYGSKEAYRQAVEAAQKAGIKVYVDIVVNHKGGADGGKSLTLSGWIPVTGPWCRAIPSK
jgi:alpha-amylase